MESDWSGWLHCRPFMVRNERRDNAAVTSLQQGTDQILELSSSDASGAAGEQAAKIVLDEAGSPILSIPDWISRIAEYFGEVPY